MTVSILMFTGLSLGLSSWVFQFGQAVKRSIATHATQATKCSNTGLCLGADRSATTHLNGVKPTLRYSTLCHRLGWLHRAQEESVNFIAKGTSIWRLGHSRPNPGSQTQLADRLVEVGVRTRTFSSYLEIR